MGKRRAKRQGDGAIGADGAGGISLTEFIQQKHLRNSHVHHSSFRTLYVRHGMHLINDVVVPTFDIGSLTAHTPRQGAFRALLHEIRGLQESPIYVENALDPAFGAALIRMGFKSDGVYSPECYVLWPDIEIANGKTV